jgi:hypothetical protein
VLSSYEMNALGLIRYVRKSRDLGVREGRA